MKDNLRNGTGTIAMPPTYSTTSGKWSLHPNCPKTAFDANNAYFSSDDSLTIFAASEITVDADGNLHPEHVRFWKYCCEKEEKLNFNNVITFCLISLAVLLIKKLFSLILRMTFSICCPHFQ
jgi:hypothetical protein